MNGFGDRPKMWSDNTTPSGANDKEAAFKDLSSSMNALSFGFIATAILVSMFLVMAIFEHLLRSRASHPPSQTNAHGRHLEMRQEQDQMPPKMIKNWQNMNSTAFFGSLFYHLCIKLILVLFLQVATTSTVDFSVLMPGQLYPTYLAQPAPLPCPREGIIWPSHDHHAFASP
ncbi:hypothetical protein B296_00010530 [Ensete ventricosum]|uniref:Uncharacterized protein n=1 Tax=Ensete ventricosum TaxID=4639 RepID=A0A427B6Q0_ENSVE|nr:hypothetical protein B296_00010530 [Ensete ventricosum]